MRFVLALLAVFAVTAVVALSAGYIEPAQAVCQSNGSGC
jgi:hypothetical protein